MTSPSVDTGIPESVAPESVPEWALRRVCDLTNVDGSHYDVTTLNAKVAGSYSIGQAFARYIAEHEEPPVDPLLIEARKLIADGCDDERGLSAFRRRVVDGDADDDSRVRLALLGIRRGIELAHAGES